MKSNSNQFRWVCALAAGCIINMMAAALLAAEKSDGSSLFTDFDYSSFQKHAPAGRPIEIAEVDTNLIAAAVFHETNHRRSQKGLQPLSYHAGARQAASIQAKIMASRGSISHNNANQPELQTLRDRLQFLGVSPRFAAENVATSFALQYQSGKPLYQSWRQGESTLSYKPGGKPIPPHTYLTFAKSLVDDWMQSPGHRKNILHTAPRHLGVSCIPSAERESAMTVFYCAQVFLR